MQRCIKLKLLLPYEESVTWEELGYLLRGLSLKTCRMSNFCLTHHLLRALKLETEYLNPQGHLYCYPYLAAEYPEVPIGIVCAAETRARKLFHKHAVNVLRGDTAMVRFRKDASIPLPVDAYKIVRISDTDYGADIQLLSRQEAKRQKLAEGALRRGVASLFRKKKDWYISIPYETEAAAPTEPFAPGRAMGVVFGQKCALAYAFTRSPKQGEIAADEIAAREARFRERKRTLLKQYPWSGRKGRGVEKALQPLRRLQEKERNYRALLNARYAKRIVELAVKNRCGEIRLEEKPGTDSPQEPILLTRWPAADLQNKICQKAEEAGITVRKCTAPNLRGTDSTDRAAARRLAEYEASNP